MKPKHVACFEEGTFFVVDGILFSTVNMIYHDEFNSTKKSRRFTHLLGIEPIHCSRPP